MPVPNDNFQGATFNLVPRAQANTASLPNNDNTDYLYYFCTQFYICIKYVDVIFTFLTVFNIPLVSSQNAAVSAAYGFMESE